MSEPYEDAAATFSEHFPGYELESFTTEPFAGIGPRWTARLVRIESAPLDAPSWITVHGEGQLDPATWEVIPEFQ